jgi:hypothetical protein
LLLASSHLLFAAEDASGGIAVLLGLAVLASAYFAPSIVALARGHHNIGSIVVINLFLGWTFIGWVVALSMALSAVRNTT